MRMYQKFIDRLKDVIQNCRGNFGEESKNPRESLRGNIKKFFDSHAKEFGKLKMKFFDASFFEELKKSIRED